MQRYTTAGEADSTVIWLEAEQFEDCGGWSNDSQFVDLMGSPYLLATGLGKPVADAVTHATVPAAGQYRLWVRCKDWLPEYSPGRFRVLVNRRPSEQAFGAADSPAWQWVDGGLFDLPEGPVEIRLEDLTGWWSRCDAIILCTDDFRPSNELRELTRQRETYVRTGGDVDVQSFDLVVVGGGPAGLGAAIAAARHGLQTALVQDRPVLGGNASSEIGIPPVNYIGEPPDTLGISGICEEIFGKQALEQLADSAKIEAIVRAEKNLTLLLNTRVTGVEMSDAATIKSVTALDVIQGTRKSLQAPLFADCTGHGWIGYYAGAEWRMGQEARDEFGETLAPVEAGTRTMGNSLYMGVIKEREEPVSFETPDFAYHWRSDSDFEPRGTHRRLKVVERPPNFDSPSHGKGRNPGDKADGGIYRSWWVEYGGTCNTIADAEHIRDELLRIVLGLWGYAKNHNPATCEANRNRELVWINYVQGVRESRRLIGDIIFTQRDIDDQILHPDTIGFTDWGIDVHHPEGFWVRGNDCIHVYQGRRASIPYRSLYSRNIDNLFIAGRCHSATHIGMGATRVMRPCCGMGQAVGTAAALARKHHTTPRGVYEQHIDALQQTLLDDGCRLPGRNA
jgi:hypothetical protein